MATDARTANRNYPKPHTDNYVSEDFARLIDAFDAIDTDVAFILAAFSGYAVVGHTHTITDVTGLQSALDGKAASGHSHALNDLSDVNVAGAANGQILMVVAGSWQPSSVPAGDWSTITSKPTDLDGYGLATEVNTLLDNLIAAAPGSLDTLNELAAALGDDPNFAATMTAALAGKADDAATTAALAAKVPTSRTLTAGTGLTGGGDLSANRSLSADLASQAEAEAGTNTTKLMNPLRTAQAIAALAGASTTYGATGTYVWAKHSGGAFTENTTVAGSTLVPAGLDQSLADTGADTARGAEVTYGGSALSGTWRAMSRSNVSSKTLYYGLFVRIS